MFSKKGNCPEGKQRHTYEEIVDHFHTYCQADSITRSRPKKYEGEVLAPHGEIVRSYPADKDHDYGSEGQQQQARVRKETIEPYL